MKKILTILSSLVFWKASPKEKPAIKSYTGEPVVNLLIRVINPEEDQLHASLGITEERLKFLADLVENAVQKSATGNLGIPGALDQISPELKHPNEIVYAGIILGSWYESSQRANAVAKMLGRSKEE